MQIGGVSAMNGVTSVPGIYSLDSAQKIQPEEMVEIRTGTKEETTEAGTAADPVKLAEQRSGLGRIIDLKA